MFRNNASSRRTGRHRNNAFRNRFGRQFAGKQKNMNIVSAIFGTASIVMLCASLVEPNWFGLSGGECCLPYLGLSLFFGHFSTETLVEIPLQDLCKGGHQESMSSCVNAKALTLIQVIISFCFFAILSSLFSFVLDVLAPRKRPLWKALKRYAIGYIFSVLNCATTVGFSYWTSQEIYNLQFDHKQYPGSKVEVVFGTGVYLVTAAGGLAILATASNLMRQYPTEEEEQAEQLLDEIDEMDDDTAGLSSDMGYDHNPPPPYVP